MINTSRITNTFTSIVHKSITDDTIANFIDYFEDAFLISKARVPGDSLPGTADESYPEDWRTEQR